MQIGIISDTHIRVNTDCTELFKKIEHAFEGVDLIIHAGDICDLSFLEHLEEIAPVEAVYGNSDGSKVRKQLESVKILEIEGIKLCISHRKPSLSFLKQEGIKIVVTGHTHAPKIEEHPEGILFLNPGSMTRPRAPPIRKMYRKERPPLPSVLILNIDVEISSAYIYSFKPD